MRTPKRHVAKDGNITWIVRFREPRGRDGRQTSETFDDEREAKRFAALIDVMTAAEALGHMQLESGTHHLPTLDEVAADHIRLLTGIEEGTRLTYTRLWGRTWGPRIGNLPATAVTRDKVAEATNNLATRYSSKSLMNQRGLLAAVCDRAVELEFLSKNPTKGLRLPRSSEPERDDMHFLTLEQFNALVDALPDRWRPLVRFLGATGCRWGEAVALNVGDIVLDGPHPHARIRRALKWSPDNNRTIGATKTRRSNRTVVLPPDIVNELAKLCRERASTELVFTAPRGGAVLHRTFWSRVWLPATEKASITPRPRIHDLRHSHASWLLAAGVPIHVVQARLGHESIQTTVGTYGHLLPDAQVAAANAAALALGQPAAAALPVAD